MIIRPFPDNDAVMDLRPIFDQFYHSLTSPTAANIDIATVAMCGFVLQKVGKFLSNVCFTLIMMMAEHFVTFKVYCSQSFQVYGNSIAEYTVVKGQKSSKLYKVVPPELLTSIASKSENNNLCS